MKKKILLGMVICLLLSGCGNQKKEETAQLSLLEGSFTIDVDSYSALAGDADYVMIGEVVEELSVDYLWPVMVENQDGTEREVTTPNTNYSVQVIENLKGKLSQKTPITITKEGGLAKDGSLYILYENDTLPVVGQQYVFYIYAQEDGSNLVSGPNSTIPIDDSSNEITSRTVQENAQNILTQIKEGVKNQTETDRIKKISENDVSVS